MVRTERNEKAVVMGPAPGKGLSVNGERSEFERPQRRDQIDSIVQQWLTDLWLLLAGEGSSGAGPSVMERDGQALAMTCGGQLRLLRSTGSALNRLRSVGIELSGTHSSEIPGG